MTPEDDRTEPSLTGDEVTLVTGFLKYQRETLAWKCAGLTPQQMATRAVPTHSALDDSFATWHAVTEAVGKVVDQLPLDTVDRPWGRHDEYSLRWILLHLVEEYARHNGHADLLREAIDGATGE
jgi:hypothetical protein